MNVEHELWKAGGRIHDLDAERDALLVIVDRLIVEARTEGVTWRQINLLLGESNAQQSHTRRQK